MTESTGSGRKIRFPLSLLFVIMTICAVLAGMNSALLAGYGRESTPGWYQVLVALVGGIVAGMILGAVVGLTHHRRAVGLGLGVAIGALLGALVGPLVLVPLQGYSAMFIATLVGAILVVGGGVAVRLTG